MRTRLHERPEPPGQQQPHRVLEADGMPQVAIPVARIQAGGVCQCRVDCRVERDPGRTRSDRAQDVEEFGFDTFHMRRVRGVVHRNPTRPHVCRLARLDELDHSVRISGDHGAGGTVDRRHVQPACPVGQAGFHLHARQGHRRHTTQTRQLPPDHPSPQRHHPRRIPQRQRPTDSSRRDLTLRMAHHRIRLDSERAPQLGQRDHHRPRDRLNHLHPLQRLTGAQHLNHVEVHERCERLGALVQPGREHRRLVQQLGTHPRPLRPLTRKHQHRPTRCLRRHTLHRHPAQPDLPVLEHRPTRSQTGSHVQRPHFTGRLQQPAYAIGLLTQGNLRLGTDHQRDDGQIPHRRLLDRLRLGGLLQDHVRVRTAHPERRHTRPTPTLHSGH